jgi:pimeloyl-ACP methyl ester carboxylesterase
MTQHLSIGTSTLAYDLVGEGPLVVLAHGMGDTRRSYRFLVPGLVAAGYRVANVDIRGCGESSVEWDGYSRTDIAGDLVALIRHLGGTAVVVGQSISGGAATIAAATAPELVVGVVELAPFTRKQPMLDVSGLLRSPRYRKGFARLAQVLATGSLPAWTRYLDLAVPTKPADWDAELARTVATMSEAGRMKVLQKMCQTSPVDAGAQLADVRCLVLVVEGSADPDWTDPRAEGERILADLPEGLGELAVIEGAGHYPHTETPDEVLALTLPFLARTLTRG